MGELSKADQLRARLAEADKHRRTSEGADRVMLHMRLGHPVAVRRGILGMLNWTNQPTGHYEFEKLDGALHSAVYAALSDVLAREADTARRIEREVTDDA